MVEEAAVVLRRIGFGQPSGSGGIEHVEDDLGAVEDARVDHLVDRRGVADCGDPEEPRLALSPQPVEGGYYILEDLPGAHRLAAARDGDGIVQMEDVHPLHAQALQAAVKGSAYGVLDPAEIAGRQADLGADDGVGGLQLSEHAAEILLGLAIAVLYRGVEVVHPGLERPGDSPFLLAGVAAHHQPADRAAAEAEDRDPHPRATEDPHLHRRSSFCRAW